MTEFVNEFVNELIIVYDGKFNPLHDGHLELIKEAEKHFSKTYDVIHKYLCPVKIRDPSDSRPSQIKSFLDNHKTDIKYLFYEGNFRDRDHYIQKLHPNAEMIHIAGIDSKIPHAFIIDDNSGKESLRKPHLSFIPDKPPICSSVTRFLENIEGSQIFNPKWLRDTDVILGKGIGGVVKLMYLGRKEVAVKLIEIPHLGLDLFHNECNILSLVSKYDISPKVYAYGIIDNIGYIVMELCYHMNKDKKYIKKDIYPIFDKYDLKDIPDIFFENVYPKQIICEEIRRLISSLHSLNIIHRDLHPDQIMFTSNKELRLIDFGLSKIVGSAINPRVGNKNYYKRSTAHTPSLYSFSDDLYAIDLICDEILESKI